MANENEIYYSYICILPRTYMLITTIHTLSCYSNTHSYPQCAAHGYTVSADIDYNRDIPLRLYPIATSFSPSRPTNKKLAQYLAKDF